MNLHSDYPFWMIQEGVSHAFPSLSSDLKTPVLVIGAGITGALVAHRLCKDGIPAVVVDKRHVGFGSTSASTALLQYEVDTPLHQLISQVGEKRAVRAYYLCSEAIGELEAICDGIPGKGQFERHPSLLYASFKKHLPEIVLPEFRTRKKHGFEVSWLEEQVVRDMFGFSAPGAILSEEGAQCNPYLLTSHLMQEIQRLGGSVFDLTTIESWKAERNSISLLTNKGLKIKAKHVVVAAGYESQNFLEKPAGTLHSTYAIVSKPLPEKEHWHKNSLLWETKTPYLYLRTIADGRILAGGRDEPFYSPAKRDRLLSRKGGELLADVKKLLPHILFELDYAWAGTFGVTEDGLPYIGNCGNKRIYYALGYGGNGITFSVIAAQLICDAIAGKKNADGALFAFDRA